MEVLLLTDILGIGKKNDLIVVKSGFALNYLLPGRKALVVTPNVRKRYAEQIKLRALEREKEREMQSSLSSALGGKTVHIAAKVSASGKLYAAVSPSAIAEAIRKEHNADVASETIVMQHPIKSTGMHAVELTVGTQTIKLSVEIRAQEPENAAKAKAA